MYELDLKNKIVKISFDTKSIGDTLAYLPQVLEFQKKHKCAVVVSTFYNDWFKLLPVYQNFNYPWYIILFTTFYPHIVFNSTRM